jgi:Na+-translocating ferredoxin:NAD+ oxidoreductase RnfG subunit
MRSMSGSESSSSRPARARAWAALFAALCLVSGTAQAKVFHSRSEALALAFPDADRIDDKSIVLDDEQTSEIERLAKSQLESRIVQIYTGYRGDEVLGYAFIDVHTVRTMPEAFLVVLTPQGDVSSLRLLAFHEPLEYMPSARWYEQFEQKNLTAPLRLGGDVHGIVGATLSARATTEGVRRALALYQVVVSHKE